MKPNNQKPFYITTTLPYVNAPLHIGHALEFVRADAVARYKKIKGFDVFFNTGTDEHGQKIFLKAHQEGISPQSFVDAGFVTFAKQVASFGISEEVHFIRTTDATHIAAAQEFWKKVADNGYIYKKQYQTKYCIGCEEAKTDSQLEDGKCPLHPDLALELIDEENYFFKLSALQEKIVVFYESHPNFIVPDFRFNEIKAFIKNGLHDFPISRLASKMSWGIPVPGDESQVMYVWFDALTNYISTLGWPDGVFHKYWEEGTPTQYCGKDNTRFQGLIWQAMLLAADIPNSYQIVVNGHITADGGTKMSKSLGNVVDPLSLVEEYGTDALRFFLLSEISSFEDSPFTPERFKESYNAKLANGLGNLTSRIMQLAETNLDSPVDIGTVIEIQNPLYHDAFATFNLQAGIKGIWIFIANLDEAIQKKEPFKIVKEDKAKGTAMIQDLVKELFHIAVLLEPFMPKTAQAIQDAIKQNKKPEAPLFARKG